MKLIVYHGSDKIIDNPTHNGGRNFSDFGLGFYITTNTEMAKSWASRKKEKVSYVNKYMLDTEGLTSLTFDLDIQYNVRSDKGIEAMSFTNSIELDDIEKEYYTNEIKEKKKIMNKKMTFIRQKYGKLGKYFDELQGDDLNG